LAKLSDDSFTRLIELFERRPPILDSKLLVQEAKRTLADANEDDVAEVVRAFVSIERARADHDWPLEQITEGLERATNIAEEEDIRRKAAERVTRAITTPAIAAAAKVEALVAANRNTLHTARVVTEIRPIWLQDPSDEPIGSVVVHDLELTYYREGEMRAFHIALDDYDLEVLGRVAERGRAKAQSLRSFLERAGLTPADGVNDGD
jgi:hypothetical protein